LTTSGARIDSDNDAVLEFESECGCTVYNLDLHLTVLIIRPLLQESSRLHNIYISFACQAIRSVGVDKHYCEETPRTQSNSKRTHV
jgi:hypothetical protein